MGEFVVSEAPSAPRRLFAADGLGQALDFVAAHVGPPTTRLMVWWPEQPFAGEPDPLVVVPLRVYRAVEVLADRVVDDWDKAWLLIDSTTLSRRDEARSDLVGAVAAALLSAAVTGIDEADPDLAP